jgi:DNA-binding winged helix-turn-helix (wHTH) protein
MGGCMSSSDLSPTMEPDAATGAARTIQLPARYIRFGPFQIDQQRQEVTKSGSRLRLQGKVYQVLLALVEKQGDVLTREELRLRLWPNETHVNYDANVNTTVNKLRQALGDSCEKPIYIETVPRKGYCLVVQTEFAEHPTLAGAIVTDIKVEAQDSSLVADAAPKKTDLWITVGVIALIVAGMLLGAGITRLWIAHFDQPPVVAPWL